MPMSRVDRRTFLQSSAAVIAAAAGLARPTPAAEPSATARKFKLGTVTYNIAKDWDLPTLLDVSKKTGLAAVELRTTHKHGVEPALSAADRAEVKKRFAGSG